MLDSAELFKNSQTKFLVFIKRQTKVKIPPPAPRGGRLQYNSDRDAHRLALGCKLHTLGFWDGMLLFLPI